MLYYSSSSLESLIDDSFSSDDFCPLLIVRHVDYDSRLDTASVGDGSYDGSHQDESKSSADNKNVTHQLDFNGGGVDYTNDLLLISEDKTEEIYDELFDIDEDPVDAEDDISQESVDIENDCQHFWREPVNGT